MQIPLALLELEMSRAMIVGLTVVLLLVGFTLLRMLAKRWIIVKPDEIAVFAGRKYKYTYPDAHGNAVEGVRGFRVVQGGSGFQWPILEKVTFCSIAGFQVPIAEEAIPNKDNVPINIRGVATCRISTAPEDLNNALSNFLGKTEDERDSFIAEILKGHIRAVIGQLDINELLRERQAFNSRVTNECSGDLKRIGISLDNLVIQEVRDAEGYIDALGKQAVALAKRDAEIATALAMRDTEIQKSNAVREASETKAKNDAKIAEANRNKDLQVAQFKTDTEKARASAESSYAIANADQQKQVKVREAERDAAAAEANTAVQEKEAMRKQRELEASVIVAAEADRRAAVIRAEADQRVAQIHAEETVLKADGDRRATITSAEAEAQKIRQIADAQASATRAVGLAKADADRAELEARAAGERAQLEAVAAGERASLLAKAEGERLLLLAKAEGVEKMNKALDQMTESARLIIVLEKISPVIMAAGDAGAKITKEIFTPIGEGLSRIDSIQITDFGGGQTAQTGITGLATAAPTIAAQTLAKAKMLGLDISGLLKKVGLDFDPSKLLSANASPSGLEKLANDLIARARSAGVSDEIINGVLKEIDQKLTPPTDKA
ncbi:MAG: SPFH domain-containing protein [Verrucomicrobiota bacterium]|nr:SPFH domain-containing protein [Verrucomicrobiota bacterium]